MRDLGDAAVTGPLDRRRQLDDVITLVAAGRYRFAPRPGLDRSSEQLDLGAGVAEVVLARDAVAAVLEDARESGAVSSVSPARGHQRPGGVGGDKLDQDAFWAFCLLCPKTVAG